MHRMQATLQRFRLNNHALQSQALRREASQHSLRRSQSHHAAADQPEQQNWPLDPAQLKAEVFLSKWQVLDNPCTVDRISQLISAKSKFKPTLPKFKDGFKTGIDERTKLVNLSAWLDRALSLQRQLDNIEYLTYKQTVLTFAIYQFVEIERARCTQSAELVESLFKEFKRMFFLLFESLGAECKKKEREELQRLNQLHIEYQSTLFQNIKSQSALKRDYTALRENHSKLVLQHKVLQIMHSQSVESSKDIKFQRNQLKFLLNKIMKRGFTTFDCYQKQFMENLKKRTRREEREEYLALRDLISRDIKLATQELNREKTNYVLLGGLALYSNMKKAKLIAQYQPPPEYDPEQLSNVQYKLSHNTKEAMTEFAFKQSTTFSFREIKSLQLTMERAYDIKIAVPDYEKEQKQSCFSLLKKYYQKRKKRPRYLQNSRVNVASIKRDLSNSRDKLSRLQSSSPMSRLSSRKISRKYIGISRNSIQEQAQPRQSPYSRGRQLRKANPAQKVSVIVQTQPLWYHGLQLKNTQFSDDQQIQNYIKNTIYPTLIESQNQLQTNTKRQRHDLKNSIGSVSGGQRRLSRKRSQSSFSKRREKKFTSAKTAFIDETSSNSTNSQNESRMLHSKVKRRFEYQVIDEEERLEQEQIIRQPHQSEQEQVLLSQQQEVEKELARIQKMLALKHARVENLYSSDQDIKKFQLNMQASSPASKTNTELRLNKKQMNQIVSLLQIVDFKRTAQKKNNRMSLGHFNFLQRIFCYKQRAGQSVIGKTMLVNLFVRTLKESFSQMKQLSNQLRLNSFKNTIYETLKYYYGMCGMARKKAEVVKGEIQKYKLESKFVRAMAVLIGLDRAFDNLYLIIYLRIYMLYKSVRRKRFNPVNDEIPTQLVLKSLQFLLYGYLHPKAIQEVASSIKEKEFGPFVQLNTLFLTIVEHRRLCHFQYYQFKRYPISLMDINRLINRQVRNPQRYLKILTEFSRSCDIVERGVPMLSEFKYRCLVRKYKQFKISCIQKSLMVSCDYYQHLFQQLFQLFGDESESAKLDRLFMAFQRVQRYLQQFLGQLCVFSPMQKIKFL